MFIPVVGPRTGVMTPNTLASFTACPASFPAGALVGLATGLLALTSVGRVYPRALGGRETRLVICQRRLKVLLDVRDIEGCTEEGGRPGSVINSIDIVIPEK